jgi:hypothetical protein
MALNPTTGIDYDVDRFVIKLVSTGLIINLNALWPRVDGAAVAGANPDRAYYKKVSVASPDADHRFQVESVSACADFSPALDPADGLPVGEYSPVYTLTPLAIEDLKLQIENQFQTELRKAFPAIEDPALLVEAADAITRKQNGALLTGDQEEKLTRVLGLGTALAQLRTRQAELNLAAEAFAADPESEAGIYDIEAGWTIA